MGRMAGWRRAGRGLAAGAAAGPEDRSRRTAALPRATLEYRRARAVQGRGTGAPPAAAAQTALLLPTAGWEIVLPLPLPENPKYFSKFKFVDFL